jgi:hypothetical protein
MQVGVFLIFQGDGHGSSNEQMVLPELRTIGA